MRVADVAFYSAITGSYNYFLRIFSRALLSAVLLLAHRAAATFAATPDGLEEIVVTASLRPEPARRIPVSTTVLDSATLRAAGLQHFGDVLGLVPNLNWAGARRDRVSSSCAASASSSSTRVRPIRRWLLIDEIDVSGVGMPARCSTSSRSRSLRGPQGTRYGANALAGLIKLNAHDPEPVSRLQTQAMTARTVCGAPACRRAVPRVGRRRFSVASSLRNVSSRMASGTIPSSA